MKSENIVIKNLDKRVKKLQKLVEENIV